MKDTNYGLRGWYVEKNTVLYGFDSSGAVRYSKERDSIVDLLSVSTPGVIGRILGRPLEIRWVEETPHGRKSEYPMGKSLVKKIDRREALKLIEDLQHQRVYGQ